MNIHFHIEQLILDGLPVASAQAPIVRHAVESELQRLLSAYPEGHSFRQTMAVNHLIGEPLQLNGRNDATRLGHQIARSVQASFGEDFSGHRPTKEQLSPTNNPQATQPQGTR